MDEKSACGALSRVRESLSPRRTGTDASRRSTVNATVIRHDECLDRPRFCLPVARHAASSHEVAPPTTPSPANSQALPETENHQKLPTLTAPAAARHSASPGLAPGWDRVGAHAGLHVGYARTAIRIRRAHATRLHPLLRPHTASQPAPHAPGARADGQNSSPARGARADRPKKWPPRRYRPPRAPTAPRSSATMASTASASRPAAAPAARATTADPTTTASA